MNYGSIKLCDCANGPGMRVSLFVSGCRHYCKGCFNEVAWAFDYGELYTLDTEQAILEALQPPYIDGLSVLGGEPLEPENVPYIKRLAYLAKAERKTVWVYTGYTWEELIKMIKRNLYVDRLDPIKILLNNIDVLVDGPFIEAEKDISLLFRGSRNQRLIDVQESLVTGRVVLWEPEESNK